MNRLPVLLLAGLAMLGSEVGCAHSDKHCEDHGPALPCQASVALPDAHRVPLEPVFLSLAVPPLGGPGDSPPSYKALTDRDCQCRAADVSARARRYDDEADEAEQLAAHPLLACLPAYERVLVLKVDVNRAKAAEDRNSVAGQALNVFYKLIEAEAKVDLQHESMNVVGEAIAKARDLQDKGLRSAEDVENLERQMSDLRADGVRLQMNIVDLNIELNKFLDLDVSTCCCKARFWPIYEPHFQPHAPDCQAAVAEGLAKRPELFMLQRIIEEMTVENFPPVRKLLHSVKELLGLGDDSAPCQKLADLRAKFCGTGRSAEELCTRRGQVEEHRAERVRAITAEITQAVHDLERQAQVVALVRERATMWQRRIADLEAKFKRALATFAEVTDARLQWIKARGDLIKEVVAWERLLVQLHFHQGVLPQDCHLGPAPCLQQAAAPKNLPAFTDQAGCELSEAHVSK